jgi:IclR family pca regulon transcriptional regulator
MLTPKIVDLGMAYISSRGIFNFAQPHMEKLVNELDQSCSLSQLDGSDIVIISRVTVPKIINLAVTVGARLPAVGTSTGHVLLAELDDTKIEEVIATPSLSIFVPAHQYTKEELFQQIKFTRQHGYSLSDERLTYGVRAVAVPIRASNGTVHSSLSVAAHANAASVEQLQNRYLPLLLDAAAAISRDWEQYTRLPNIDIPSLASTIPPPYTPQFSR